MFNCSKCGECCKNLHLNPLYSELDRGDNVCKYFDETTNLCSIYEKRPIICNVDKMYDVHFKGIMTLEEYYYKNKEGCEKIGANR